MVDGAVFLVVVVVFVVIVVVVGVGAIPFWLLTSPCHFFNRFAMIPFVINANYKADGANKCLIQNNIPLGQLFSIDH